MNIVEESIEKALVSAVERFSPSKYYNKSKLNKTTYRITSKKDIKAFLDIEQKQGLLKLSAPYINHVETHQVTNTEQMQLDRFLKSVIGELLRRLGSKITNNRIR